MNEQGSETWGYLYLSVSDTQKPKAEALFKTLGQSSSGGPSYSFHIRWESERKSLWLRESWRVGEARRSKSS